MLKLNNLFQRFLHFIFVYKNLPYIQRICGVYTGDIR